jgi:hypothetical protein
MQPVQLDYTQATQLIADTFVKQKLKCIADLLSLHEREKAVGH